MSSKAYRSTAWLNGQMQWHLTSTRQENGTYKATTNQVPGASFEAAEESQAINGLKAQLRERAVRGEI